MGTEDGLVTERLKKNLSWSVMAVIRIVNEVQQNITS